MAAPDKTISSFDGTLILVRTITITSAEIHENKDNADLVSPCVSGCHMQAWCPFPLYWRNIFLTLKIISVVDHEYIYLFKVCLLMYNDWTIFIFIITSALKKFCFCLQGIHCKSKPSGEYTSFTVLLCFFKKIIY